MKKKPKNTIVLAWINQDANSKYYRHPRSVIWLREGSEEDVAKAQAYANKSGYRLFLYPTDEPDPLQRARETLVDDVVFQPLQREGR